MEVRSGVGNLEYGTDREKSKNFKLFLRHNIKKNRFTNI